MISFFKYHNTMERTKYLRCVIVAVIMLASTHMMAAEETQDTVYFYQTWEQMLNSEPVSMYVSDTEISPNSCAIDFYFEDEKVDYLVNREFLAATVGDSVWFVNPKFLADRFNGDVTRLTGYVPVFFNEKVAFIAANQGTKSNYKTDFFYIDFLNHRVVKVDHKSLTELLGDYHDLLMRYESFKDYKNKEIIQDYFYKFIDRASQDVMRPDILDLVDDNE